MGVLVGLQRDVITEPLGLLVGVGVATHVREQRRVVDDRSLVLVETEVLGETQRDPALAQYVLHRLAEPEVDTERQRTDELRQTNAFKIGRLVHSGATLTLPTKQLRARRSGVTRPSNPSSLHSPCCASPPRAPGQCRLP